MLLLILRRLAIAAVTLPEICFIPSAYATGAKSSLGTIQTFASFSNPFHAYGVNPSAPTGLGGTFYGTTEFGGSQNRGTIYSFSPASGLKTVASFTGFPARYADQYPNGEYPIGGLTDIKTKLYGTTSAGGAPTLAGPSNNGTLFSFMPQAGVSTLASFNGGAGAVPTTSLIHRNGTIYGTTEAGGTTFAGYDHPPKGGAAYSGNIFSYTTSGGIQNLASFNGSNGASPSQLTDVNGTFYGTTYVGGTAASNDGTLFSYTPSAGITRLANFSGTDGGGTSNGAQPAGGLTYMDGALYGTTSYGGTNGDGTLFQYTPATGLRTLASFTGANGARPIATLKDLGGILYGTTATGGPKDAGTLFSYNPISGLNTVATFSGTDSRYSASELVADGGALIGTSNSGGSAGLGSIYRYQPSPSILEARDANLGESIDLLAKQIRDQKVPNLRAVEPASGFRSAVGTVIVNGLLSAEGNSQKFQYLYYSANTFHKTAQEDISHAEEYYTSGNQSIARYWLGQANAAMSMQSATTGDMGNLYTNIATTASSYVIQADEALGTTALAAGCTSFSGGLAVAGCIATADALDSASVFMIQRQNGSVDAAARDAVANFAENLVLTEIPEAKLLDVAGGSESLNSVVSGLLNNVGIKDRLENALAGAAIHYGLSKVAAYGLNLAIVQFTIANYGNVSSVSDSTPSTAVQTAGNGSLGGGVLNVGRNKLYNSHDINGIGDISAGQFVNNGEFNVSGGAGHISASTTNYKSMQVKNGRLTISGNLSNYGNVTVSRSSFNVSGSFSDFGSFSDSPSNSKFHDVYVGPSGYFSIAGAGQITVSGNFINNSERAHSWRTGGAILDFVGPGSHVFSLVGQDRGSSVSGFINNFSLGTLDLTDLSGYVTLAIGNPAYTDALYVRRIVGLNFRGGAVDNVIGDGLNIYYLGYLPENVYLSGMTYLLQDGGYLIPINTKPVPEPGSFVILLTGLLFLLCTFGISGMGRSVRSPVAVQRQDRYDN